MKDLSRVLCASGNSVDLFPVASEVWLGMEVKASGEWQDRIRWWNGPSRECDGSLYDFVHHGFTFVQFLWPVWPSALLLR